MRVSRFTFPSGAAGRRGFALLITLTLLAFVVLLLVGLGTYTRVETAIAGNMQRQAEAREHALLGLNVALEQLQRHAGPDTRATATAENFPEVNRQKRHYTGIWNAAPASATEPMEGETPATPTAPIAWLASGAETSAGIDITATVASARSVVLVGAKTDGSGSGDETVAELQDVTAPGVPGAPTGATPIGRYAWWIGDQGVKAPVAVASTAEAVDYAPYVDATGGELRARIGQQIALGAAATTTGGAPAFEPRDANNEPLVRAGRIVAPNQLAFLRTAEDSPVGLPALRQNFHAWSPNNFAVIADTRRGGLRQDLSLLPQRLGGAYSAWARYERPRAVNMEPAVAGGVADATPAAPRPIPEYSATDPLRRRYFITPSDSSGGVEAGVHPVLTFFGISFSLRQAPSSSNYEVAARCVVGLWNPFTSALVPPAFDGGRLEIRISRLPRVTVRDSGGIEHQIDLHALYGDPLRIRLAWPETPAMEDEASWLPGRVHYWAAEPNDAEPRDGNLMKFNERNPAYEGQGVVRATALAHSPAPSSGPPLYRQCAAAATALRVELFREGVNAPIARFDSPEFQSFETAPSQLEIQHRSADFAYVFRLPDPSEVPEGESQPWLSAAGRDPRLTWLRGGSFVAGENGPHPEQYGGVGVTSFRTRFPSRLLDRATNRLDYNEDVPVFELPRGPILSVGALQHLALPAARPFAIGNPWGSAVQVSGMPANELFDRFFFSGISAEVVATETSLPLALPNPLLKPLRKADGAHVTLADIRATAVEVPPVEPPTEDSGGTDTPEPEIVVPVTGRSSKYFLQGGAFNVNSANAAAWAAVLRSVRFAEPSAFSYLDVSSATGTAEDSARATVQSGEARFFRFPQSAQETFKAESNSGAEAEDGVTPPNTLLYRRGMRTLTEAQLAALAEKVAELVRLKLASTDATFGGPFRSLEEFLSGSPLFAGLDADGNPLAPRSLLEAAIADSGINAEIPEFSSQWLTQADIMSALAPVLFPRSDTFIVRTHGQALNPATGAVEGRAWCEAIVQRLPEYLDPTTDDAAVLPADLQGELNRRYGRRFKIVSFRWLTAADI